MLLNWYLQYSWQRRIQEIFSAKKPTCYFCGGNHLAPICNKKGHLIRCCRNTQKRPNKSSTNINEVVEDHISQLYMFPSSKTKLLKTVVNIDGKEVEMENDTRVLVSVMTHTEYKSLCNQKSRDSRYMKQE